MGVTLSCQPVEEYSRNKLFKEIAEVVRSFVITGDEMTGVTVNTGVFCGC